MPGEVGRPLIPLRARTVALLTISLVALGLTPLPASAVSSSGPVVQQLPDGGENGFAALANHRIYQAWEWAFRQRAYPLGYIPANARRRALQQIARLRAGVPGPLGPGDPWVNLGPSPILGGQIGATPNARPVSGRISYVAVDPSDASRWLVGAAQGGVWETRDAGLSWTAMTDDQDSLAMGAIAFAPSDPNVVYAGTGEANFSGDAYAGAGLLKSLDGGATWQLLGAPTFANTTFSDIRVNPADANVVLAATAYGFAGRDGGFTPPPPPRGILKSTDGGTTWAQRLNGDATALKVRPGNFSNQYAGLGNIFGGPANGVYRSTDSGETWTLVPGPWTSLPGGVGRVVIAIAPSDSNVAYVSIQDAFDGVGVDGGLLGLWRSNNAWAPSPIWTRIATGATDDGSGLYGYCGWDAAFRFRARQCWYSHDIIVDPADANILYAGGIPLWKFDGSIWTEISKTVADPLRGIHADQHALAFAGSRLIAGNDGGVWSSPDGGNTWNEHNSLGTVQFYHGSLHPTNPNFALGGSQDNGTEIWTGTSDWRWIFGGDGGESVIASTAPDLRWAVTFQRLGIRRTLDGGSTFTIADGGIDKTNAPFIARVKKCPANDDVLIAGTDNLWKSTNFFSAPSPSWAPNSPKLGRGGDGRPIEITAAAFASSDATCSTYAFGTTHGPLRLTTDGGVSWVDINPGGDVPARYVTALAFHPTDANILYVTLSGFDEGTPLQPGHVFQSTDLLLGAPTWADVTPPVNLPHNAVAVDPADPNNVYVGTDLGVWQTTDAGTTWIPSDPSFGMPNVAVFDLQINRATNRVAAFTHGRGALVHLP